MTHEKAAKIQTDLGYANTHHILDVADENGLQLFVVAVVLALRHLGFVLLPWVGGYDGRYNVQMLMECMQCHLLFGKASMVCDGGKYNVQTC